MVKGGISHPPHFFGNNIPESSRLPAPGYSLNLFADSVKWCNNKKLFEAAVAGTLEITGEKFSPCTGGKPLNMAMYSGLKE